MVPDSIIMEWLVEIPDIVILIFLPVEEQKVWIDRQPELRLTRMREQETIALLKMSITAGPDGSQLPIAEWPQLHRVDQPELEQVLLLIAELIMQRETELLLRHTIAEPEQALLQVESMWNALLPILSADILVDLLTVDIVNREQIVEILLDHPNTTVEVVDQTILHDPIHQVAAVVLGLVDTLPVVVQVGHGLQADLEVVEEAQVNLEEETSK